MWTRSDETLYRVAEFGQQDLGMPPFGLAYGGELKANQIEYIVNFMRYTWDSRAEIPEDAAAAGAAAPAPCGRRDRPDRTARPGRDCSACLRPDAGAAS